jgi:hypothetical protein
LEIKDDLLRRVARNAIGDDFQLDQASFLSGREVPSSLPCVHDTLEQAACALLLSFQNAQDEVECRHARSEVKYSWRLKEPLKIGSVHFANAWELICEVIVAMKKTDWEFGIESEENRLFAVVGDEAADLLILVDIDERQAIIAVTVRLERRYSQALRQRMANRCNDKNTA